MRKRVKQAGGSLGIGLAVTLAAVPAPAAAQVFDLPPGDTPRPPVVGPADPEDPAASAPPSPARPTPTATPTIAPSAQPNGGAVEPQPTRTGPVTAGPAANAGERVTQGSRAAATAAQAPNAAQAPAADEPPLPEPGPSVAPGTAAGTVPSTQAQTSPSPGVARQFGPPDERSSGWPWLVFAALGALLAGAVVWWSRLRQRRVLPPAKVSPAPLPSSRPAEAAPSSLTRPPAPETPAAPSHPELALALEATRMSATLVNTVLSYRLVLTNRAETSVENVRVEGDMIAAHASRPESELLGSASGDLALLHAVASLAAGESITLTGELRLPLSAITPIRSGDAALFVPLARLRAAGVTASGEPVRGSGTFLVGQPAASARLQPFRLDLGPRLYSRVGQQLLASSA